MTLMFVCRASAELVQPEPEQWKVHQVAAGHIQRLMLWRQKAYSFLFFLFTFLAFVPRHNVVFFVFIVGFQKLIVITPLLMWLLMACHFRARTADGTADALHAWSVYSFFFCFCVSFSCQKSFLLYLQSGWGYWACHSRVTHRWRTDSLLELLPAQAK